MIHHKYIEALLFASAVPLTFDDLAHILETNREELAKALDSYGKALESENRGLRLRVIGEKVELVSASDCVEYVNRIREKEEKLSPAALETLAVIAFKQPITKAEIEEIRGVNCDNVIKHLLHKELITQLGRKAILGRPMLYGTTEAFLHSIGVGHIEDLRNLIDGEK